MEPVHQQPTQPAPKPASPSVMDVVPPRPMPAEPLKMPPQEIGALPMAKPEESPKKTAKEKAAKPAVTRPPKAPSSGVGLAIFATIVIVLGLGAMIVYAYLRTNGISIS